MISTVSGNVIAIRSDVAVLEVGGVGLAITCAPRTLAALRPGQLGMLHTSLVVREDSLTLFGFATDDERHVFEVLQTAQGIGPRVAQAVLATHEPDAIRIAIATGDVKALTLVPGIGTKGAQRMLVDLKDKLGPAMGVVDLTRAAPHGETPVVANVREALLGLGTKPMDADEALRGALEEVPATDSGALLKAALRLLDRR